MIYVPWPMMVRTVATGAKATALLPLCFSCAETVTVFAKPREFGMA